MKYTLLELTQRILESMDSDEVNAYDETIESTAVANVIKETYWYLVGRMDLPSHHKFFQLDASGDNTKPVLMTLPSAVLDVDYIKYQTPDAASNTEYNEVSFLPLEEFLHRTLTLKESETEVSTMTVDVDGDAFEFKYHNERKPSNYTTLDDTNIVFDAYDATVDSTLQKSKTLCYGKKIPTFTMADNFTPALDAQQFSLLLNEAKSQAFIELKQVQNAHSEYRSRKNFINTQRTKNNVPSHTRGLNSAPNFGRRTQK